MQISSRFTIAIHTMMCIETYQDDFKITSDFIANSVNVNPVIIRNVLGQLKKANLVAVTRGSGGATIIPAYDTITLYDIFMAVDSINASLFSFHDNPNPDCPIGKNVHYILDDHLESVQRAMEDSLKAVSFADLVDELNTKIKVNTHL